MEHNLNKTPKNSFLHDVVVCILIFAALISIAGFLLHSNESKAFESIKNKIYLAYPFQTSSTTPIVLFPDVIPFEKSTTTPSVKPITKPTKPVVKAPEETTHVATTTPAEPEPVVPPKIPAIMLSVDGRSVTQDFSTIPVSNWSIATGTMNVSLDSFILGARLTPLSLAYLNGSYSWDNYLAEVIVDWGEGNEFSIVNRFDSPLDYVTCTFLNYGQYAVINAYRDGEHVRSMKSVELPTVDFQGWLNNRFAARVSGNTITCLVNGEPIITGTIPKGLKEGSFGFKVEDTSKVSSNVSIKRLKVTPF